MSPNKEISLLQSGIEPPQTVLFLFCKEWARTSTISTCVIYHRESDHDALNFFLFIRDGTTFFYFSSGQAEFCTLIRTVCHSQVTLKVIFADKTSLRRALKVSAMNSQRMTTIL